MVQRVQVILEDDVTGGEATETVEFSLDGVTYEIDLNDENATRLRNDLAGWIADARRAGGRRQTRRRGSGAAAASNGSASGRAQELAAMREWGRDNGYKVSSRGRVPQELQDAYAAAH
ncbi:histone-like nucleoid-structuring protein Lsr2 [Ornithinimicrobium tianjinense]|uniref:Protein lsr2 n=1 Tax=Ornithinimicrobium tianjinense TaxID=1195761 RepID=A0A917BCR2_9MICO|nr:Lsr2 family protein [Ornithinimicrobium tianjinense]GGF37741.1 protein lsr2 precursor [Ornithinimicrobium tianjinense]